MAKEDDRISELEARIGKIKYALEQFIPVYNIFDRRRTQLEWDLKRLEKEKMDLVQGQLIFDPTAF